MYNILWETLNDSEKKKNKEKLYVITAGNEDLFKKMTIANQNNISFPISLQVGRPLLEKQGPSYLLHSLQQSESTLMDLTTAGK